MADVNEQANKLGIDPSGYGTDKESQRRLQERIKQVQAERDSFDNEEARGGPIPETVVSKNSISGQTTPTGRVQQNDNPAKANSKK